jgi:hypothetical protein
VAKLTLAEVMPERKVGRKCLTCALPPDLLREVNDQKLKHGRSASEISIGLKRMGINIGDSAIGQHFRNDHAKKEE